jgi:hypothetical protein
MPGPVLREMRASDVPTAHDELVEHLRAGGVVRPRLFAYAGNARGRRFWEKHGWRPTGETARGSFPPYAELLAYELRAPRR